MLHFEGYEENNHKMTKEQTLYKQYKKIHQEACLRVRLYLTNMILF